MFDEANITTPVEIIDKTQAWVDNGMSVDGIPYMHRLDEITWFQWEQLSFNVLFCIMICLVFFKVLKNGKIGEQVSKNVDILMKDHDQDRKEIKKVIGDMR